MTDFNKAVRIAAIQKDMKLQDIAESIGSHPVSFNRMIKGNPTKDSIDRIAKALGIKVSELMKLGE